MSIPHVNNTAALVFSVQNFFDLKVVKETKEYHARSHSQWAIVNKINAKKPISIAFIIRDAPTVAHHKKK